VLQVRPSFDESCFTATQQREWKRSKLPNSDYRNWCCGQSDNALGDEGYVHMINTHDRHPSTQVGQNTGYTMVATSFPKELAPYPYTNACMDEN
jgi:hypothetical protein